MNKIIISNLVAALIVGNIFYISFKEVDAHHEYIQAATYAAKQPDPQSVISRRVEKKEGGAFTSRWARAQDTSIVEKSEIEKEHLNPVQKNSKIKEKIQVEEVQAVQKELPKTLSNSAPKNSVVPVSKKVTDTATNPVADHILMLLNNIRDEAGLTILNRDPILSEVANGHSNEMAKHEYLSHTNLQGCSFTCRIESSGFKARAWAENIGFVERADLLDSPKKVAAYMVESWMDSPQHRRNILHEEYTNIGIGITKNGSDVYITTDFALPR